MILSNIMYILNQLKISYFKCDQDISEYSTQKFKLFLFDAENNGYKKIRLPIQN